MFFPSLRKSVHVLSDFLSYVPLAYCIPPLRGPHIFARTMHEVFHPTPFIIISIRILEFSLAFPQPLDIVTDVLRVIREPYLVAFSMNLIVEVFAFIY